MAKYDHDDLVDKSTSEVIVSDPSRFIANRFQAFAGNIHSNITDSDDKHTAFTTWHTRLIDTFIECVQDVKCDEENALATFYVKFEPYAKWFVAFGYMLPSKHPMDTGIINRYALWRSGLPTQLPDAAQVDKATSGDFKLSMGDLCEISHGKALYDVALHQHMESDPIDSFEEILQRFPNLEYNDRHHLMIMDTPDMIDLVEELRAITEKQSKTVLHAKDIIEDHKTLTIQRNNLKDQLVIATNAVIPLQEENGNLMTFQRRVLGACGFSHEGLSSGAVTIDDLIDIINDAIDGDDDG